MTCLCNPFPERPATSPAQSRRVLPSCCSETCMAHVGKQMAQGWWLQAFLQSAHQGDRSQNCHRLQLKKHCLHPTYQLINTDFQLPFRFKRRQFPVKLAFEGLRICYDNQQVTGSDVRSGSCLLTAFTTVSSMLPSLG
ncbi:TPA: hypothetical protein ACH3X2_013929 [Trebouxia sp. C0005]